MAEFVSESNRIEGIIRGPTVNEIEATIRFVDRKPEELTVTAVELLVSVLEPTARIRKKAGMNVRVGSHIAIPGGVWVEPKLNCLLEDVRNRWISPWQAHCDYEKLHPFTDCNGRSGRALWLWMMGERGLQLPFLHHFYYQTLENVR